MDMLDEYASEPGTPILGAPVNVTIIVRVGQAVPDAEPTVVVGGVERHRHRVPRAL